MVTSKVEMNGNISSTFENKLEKEKEKKQENNMTRLRKKKKKETNQTCH